MKLLNHLSIDLKLQLISKLSESITLDFQQKKIEKKASWKSLIGAWKDMDNDIIDDISAYRLPEREVPKF